MARTDVTQLKVVILSASDMEHEQEVIRAVIGELNVALEKAGLPVSLLPVRWTELTKVVNGQDPQRQINLGLFENFDIAVGLMWRRYASPTPRSNSAMEEEVNIVLREIEKLEKKPERQGKKLMFFFCERPIPFPQNDGDVKQLKAALTFKKKVMKLGLVDTFQYPEELHWKAYGQLMGIAIDAAMPLVVAKPKQPTLAAEHVKEPELINPEGSVLLFSGGYLRLEHDEALEPPNLTVEAWVCALTSGDMNAVIVRKAPHLRPGFVLRWHHVGDDHIQLRLDLGGSVAIARGPEYKTYLQKWTHIAGTFDSQKKKAALFVNGKRVGTAEADKLVYSRDILTIGGSPHAPSESFNGAISYVRVSDRPIYEGDFQPERVLRKEASTVLLMPLTEGTGHRVADLVTGHHALIIGSTRWVRDSVLLKMAEELGK